MLSFVLGMVFGMTVMLIAVIRLIVGTLRIDHSDPVKDLYRFEIDDLDKLNKKSMIVLKIDHDAHFSQD